MAVLTLDTLEDAELEVRATGGTKTRTGIISGINIDCTSGSDALVLEKAVAALTAAGNGLGTSLGGLLLQRVRAKPITPDTCHVWMYYEAPTGAQPSVYIIRDGSHTASYRTNLVPGTRTPLRCRYDDPQDPKNKVPEDFCESTILLGVRARSISALIYGTPDLVAQDYVGTCNGDLFMGRDKGHWLCREWRTDISRFQGFYSLEATIMTRGPKDLNMDWSEVEVLRNHMTGRYVPVEDAIMSAAIDLPYKFGIIWPTADSEAGMGFIRWGPYITVPFRSIFQGIL